MRKYTRKKVWITQGKGKKSEKPPGSNRGGNHPGQTRVVAQNHPGQTGLEYERACKYKYEKLFILAMWICG